MEVKFSKPFEKDLRAITEKAVVLKVEEIISVLRHANLLAEMENIKKLKGHKDCYRIRLGNYRLGLQLEGKTVGLARLMHRKEIYRHFP